MFRGIWPAFLVLSCVTASMAASNPVPDPFQKPLERRERQISRPMNRASQFVNVLHLSSQHSCEDVQPPEALTTPDPLFSQSVRGRRVKVSFIVGTDGRVHSPLILESAGLSGDRRVLQTVRSWRYRPATCNGVPTEMEGKIEFSSR